MTATTAKWAIPYPEDTDDVKDYPTTAADAADVIDGMLSALSYVELTAQVFATGSADANNVTVLEAGTISCDGVERIRIEFFVPDSASSDNTNGLILSLYDALGTGKTNPIGLLSYVYGLRATHQGAVHCVRELVPAAGDHKYGVCIRDGGAITALHASVQGGNGGAGQWLPGFLKVSKIG